MHAAESVGILVLIVWLGDKGPATTAGGRSKLVVALLARLEQLCSEQCLPVQRTTGEGMEIARIMRRLASRTKGQM